MPFLKNYMTWNEGTEVPQQYYFWTGLTALAAIVNGQVWGRIGRYAIFPNLYVVLLGPPANGKTAAMRRAESLIREFKDISLSAQSETPEGLVKFMAKECVRDINLENTPTQYTPVTCILSELSNFFGRDPAGMIDVLTGIWDCGGAKYHRRTKGQGEDVIPRPNLNLVAGTTQDWITTYLKSDIIGGGFTRRVIFVNEMMTDDTTRIAWPEDTPEMLTARSNCIAYGKVLRNVRGEMRHGPGARAWWDKWYNNRPIPREPDIRGYHKGSKPAYLVKVATLVALSKAPELVINVNDFEVALALLDATETHLLKVFQGIGRNELNAVANKIVSFLEASPEKGIIKDGKKVMVKLTPDKIIQATFYKEAPSRELNDIFNHLIASDKIFRFGINGRQYFGLTESIRDVPSGDETQEKK